MTHVTVRLTLLALVLFGGHAMDSFTAVMIFCLMLVGTYISFFFFKQKTAYEIATVTGVQTCALPIFRYDLQRQINNALKTLTPREERVLRKRFGIGENTDHTLEEVGQDFAVTRERIRQIEAKALRKLRHPSRSKKLRAFLEGRT